MMLAMWLLDVMTLYRKHTSTQLINSGRLSPVEAMQIDARLSKIAVKPNSLLFILWANMVKLCVDARRDCARGLENRG